MFAVIFVDQCYDSIDGVECLASYAMEQEANDFVQKRKDAATAARMRLIKCVDDFVAGIRVPTVGLNAELTVSQWWEWLKSYGLSQHYVTVDNFKERLKQHIAMHWQGFKHPDFHLPDLSEIAADNNLFVVEIK